jgi:hypothetical protein
MSDAAAVNNAMDDLPAFVAQFEEDVGRIDIFVNGDATQNYETADGRAVPSLSKIVANVETMIKPDTDAITQGARDAQAAATAAQGSATAASGSAGGASESAAAALGYMGQASASAIEAGDSRDRAEAAANTAGDARDEAVGAMNSVQQNADAATGAANRAQQSETNAGTSASAASASAKAAATSETNAADSATGSRTARDASAASATAAGGSATNAATSATEAADSAREAAQSIPGLILLETQGPINGGASQNVFKNFVGPYDQYEMIVTGLVAYTDLTQFFVQFSHDNGATFINTQYSYVQMFNSGATVAVNSQTAQNIIQMWGNVSGINSGPPWGQLNGIIRFFNLAAAGGSPARLPFCTFDLGGVGSTGTVTAMKGSGALVALNGQPVNAIRVGCSGEGFQSGTLSLYGRRR